MCAENGQSRFVVFDDRVKKAVAEARRLRSDKAYQLLESLWPGIGRQKGKVIKRIMY